MTYVWIGLIILTLCTSKLTLGKTVVFVGPLYYEKKINPLVTQESSEWIRHHAEATAFRAAYDIMSPVTEQSARQKIYFEGQRRGYW